MFVMNFGAVPRDPQNGDWSFIIPNEAITSQDGFPGQDMPLLWLLNANEGAGYPLRVVNFLNGYAHARDVYAAVVVPGVIQGWRDTNNDRQPDDVNNDNRIDQNDLIDLGYYGYAYGPIWDEAGGPIAPPGQWGYIPLLWGPPVIEIDVSLLQAHQQDEHNWNPFRLTLLQILTWVVAHELGHTVLWHHQPGYGHHAGNTTFDCFMWHVIDWRQNPPIEFCANNPGCQTRWKLNP